MPLGRQKFQYQRKQLYLLNKMMAIEAYLIVECIRVLLYFLDKLHAINTNYDERLLADLDLISCARPFCITVSYFKWNHTLTIYYHILNSSGQTGVMKTAIINMVTARYFQEDGKVFASGLRSAERRFTS